MLITFEIFTDIRFSIEPTSCLSFADLSIIPEFFKNCEHKEARLGDIKQNLCRL